jgi:tripartite-type tricarboxylate transporter receptor subunit TctC
MTARRTLLAAGLLAPAVARTQVGWPDRPIRLIYPFAPGAGDFLARAIGERMREVIGQPFVVDNRPGANTMIGAEVKDKEGRVFRPHLSTVKPAR